MRMPVTFVVPVCFFAETLSDLLDMLLNLDILCSCLILGGPCPCGPCSCMAQQD